MTKLRVQLDVAIARNVQIQTQASAQFLRGRPGDLTTAAILKILSNRVVTFLEGGADNPNVAGKLLSLLRAPQSQICIHHISHAFGIANANLAALNAKIHQLDLLAAENDVAARFDLSAAAYSTEVVDSDLILIEEKIAAGL